MRTSRASSTGLSASAKAPADRADPPKAGRLWKLTLQYEGTDFAGWQRQQSERTVQGALEAAAARILGAPHRVTGAGRTDAGVHAQGQVAHLATKHPMAAPTLLRALNAVLPPDLRVAAVEAAPAGFHANRSATAKTYRYQIATGPVCPPLLRRQVLHVPERLRVGKMRAAARRFEGRHDFSAFCAAGATVQTRTRTIFESRLRRTGGLLCYQVRGNGFLRYMVRNLVGTLLEVGHGRLEPEAIPSILRSRDRRRAGPTAPPQGLVLVSVEYS